MSICLTGACTGRLHIAWYAKLPDSISSKTAATFRAVSLNPILRPRVPKPIFSGCGALQNRSGTCLDASGLFFAKKLRVEMVKPLYKRCDPNILGFQTFLNGSFASLLGRIHFRKTHPNKTSVSNMWIYGPHEIWHCF